MSLKRTARRTLRNAPKALVPIMLAGALAVGGASAEGFGAHAMLLLVYGVVAALALAFWQRGRAVGGLLSLIIFLAALGALGASHLIALPAETMEDLPGRELIPAGWELLGIEPRHFPLSMAPERTSSALAYLILPLAAILIVFRLGWTRATSGLPWAVALMGAASAALGLAQVLLPAEDGLYLFENTSRGLPVGFFANANHQASFLLMTLPFTAVLVGQTRSDWRSGDKDMARLVIIGALSALQIIGIMAVGSVAGYLMLLPILLLSVLVVGSRRRTFSGKYSTAALLAILIGGTGLVASSPQLSGLGMTSFSDEGMSRLAMARVTSEALDDHIWLGSGLGTFEPVFKLYEDPSGVTATFANHAHNEYLQWALETGLPGLLLLTAFLIWWLWQSAKAWRTTDGETARVRRAASVATLVVFLHSFVDYPARTPAILFFATVCLALLVMERRVRVAADAEADTEAQRTVTL